MDEHKAKGNEAFKAKRFQEAIQHYTKAIEVSPDSEAAGAVYSNRAGSWQSLGNYQKALEDSEQCIRVRPDWLKGYFRKGVALQSMERMDEALTAFSAALKTEPNNQEVQDKIKALNVLIKERNEKAKAKACKTPEEAKQVGNSLFKDGKYDQAAEFYTRAIELQKEPTKEKSTFYSNRAACHQQSHLYSLMIDDCNAAIELDDTNVKAYIRRAIAYEGMEKWKAALDDYNKAKSLAPGLSNVSQGIVRCQRALR